MPKKSEHWAALKLNMCTVPTVHCLDILIDTIHIFNFNVAQCSLVLGMSQGQESNFLAVFDLLYSSSGPQKPQYKSGQKFISSGPKNKMTMFYHVKRYLDFSQGIDF